MRRRNVRFGRCVGGRAWTAWVAAGVLLIAGCGPGPTKGGTAGRILAGGQPLSEVQVTVHRIEAGTSQPLGFGVPRADGSFQLVTTDASGPLLLAPGEYRCTIESIGAPVAIPATYQSADATPLHVQWSSDSRELTLEVPALSQVR